MAELPPEQQLTFSTLAAILEGTVHVRSSILASAPRCLWAIGLLSWLPDVAAAITPNVNAVNFTPASGRYRLFAVGSADVGPAWEPYGHVLFHGERNSLSITAGDHTEWVVHTHTFADINVGVGLWGFMSLDVGLPVAMTMESDPDTTSVSPLSGGGLGDMVVRLRGTPLSSKGGGFGVGLSLGATVPTGDGDQFRGDPGAGLLANVVLDHQWSTVRLSANVGTRIRFESASFYTAEFGSELTFGLGTLVEVFDRRLGLAIELSGRTPFSDFMGSLESTSLEIMLGPRWWVVDGLALELGLGTGLIQGYGTPEFRFVTGVSWAPSIPVVTR